MTRLLLALALATACSSSPAHERSPDSVARDPVAVHVAPVTIRQRPLALTLDGTLVADEESNVTAVVSGRVVKVFVERGSKVDADTPLVALRDVDYRLQAKTARAQLAEARARLGMRKDGGAPPDPNRMPDVLSAKAEMELADADLKRTEALAANGVLSAQELDTARTRAQSAHERHRNSINAARASVAALQTARASLEQATTSAGETTVRAPFAGEIADRMISVGEYVSPQTPLVTLVRIDPLRIELSVPQQHLRDVQPGQTVTLVVDAVADRTFEATVRYVSAAVQRDTRSLRVEAVVPNADGLLRPGLFATARLQTGGQQAVAEVPSAAVRTEAGVSRVFVVADGVVEERVVSIAEQVGDTAIVAEGLAEGDQVAVDALERLGDGVAVEVQADAD
jgi:RND family efflux transporter MFP subunit